MGYRAWRRKEEHIIVMCARLAVEGVGRYADQIAGHRRQAGVPSRGQRLKAHNGWEDLGMCLASGFKPGIGNRLR